jgi:hypothetical protein
MNPPNVTTGVVPFHDYETWYRVTGDLSSGIEVDPGNWTVS